jgi:hypothetical protein
MRSRRIRLAALVCGSLALAACGGNSDGGGDVDAAAVAPSTIPPADAAALAQSVLLRHEDLPADWTQDGPQTSEDRLHFVGAECTEFEDKFNGPLLGEVASYTSPTIYDMNVGLTHTVAVTDAATAEWARGALALPNAPSCFEAAIRAVIGEDVAVRSSRPSLDPARASSELEVFVTVPIDGFAPIELKYSIGVTVDGNIVSMLDISSSNYLPLDQAALRAKAAARLSAAEG